MNALQEDDAAWTTSESMLVFAGERFGTQPQIDLSAPSTSAAFSSGGLIVLDHFRCDSGWIGERLAQVRQLRDNWDGYGAPPIAWPVVRKMSECLSRFDPVGIYKPASLVPGADGSLQAEWHLRDFSIEFRVDPDETVSLVWSDRDTGATEEWFGQEAIENMNARLHWLHR